MRIANPLGKKGEDLAVQFLQEKGYTILERNYRKKYAEIDIIAIDNTKIEPILVFIEVKTRSSNAFGTPLEAITPRKLQNLFRTMQLYIATHKNLQQSVRVDAIAILGNTIDHIENITQ